MIAKPEVEMPPDPTHDIRVRLGTATAALLAAAGVLSPTLVAYADGSHSSWLSFDLPQFAVFLVLAVLVGYMVRHPNKPDVKVAQASLLGAAVVAVVVGLDAFISSLDAAGPGIVDVYPGPRSWTLLVATAGLLYLRYTGAMWPESRMLLEVYAARQRPVSKRR